MERHMLVERWMQWTKIVSRNSYENYQFFFFAVFSSFIHGPVGDGTDFVFSCTWVSAESQKQLQCKIQTGEEKKKRFIWFQFRLLIFIRFCEKWHKCIALVWRFVVLVYAFDTRAQRMLIMWTPIGLMHAK